jgi:carboxylesterase
MDALESSTWEQWYDSAARALHRLDRPPLVVGLSMGGLLALRLAAEHHDELHAVATLATPLETPQWKIQAAEMLARARAITPLRRFVGRHRKGRVDVRIQRVAQRSPSFASFPYEALAQLGELQHEVRGVLEHVRAPLLVLHGRFDHSASPRDSWRVSQGVSSAHVRRVLMPRSYHLLTRDLDQERVCSEIIDFVGSLPTGRPPADA